MNRLTVSSVNAEVRVLELDHADGRGRTSVPQLTGTFLTSRTDVRLVK